MDSSLQFQIQTLQPENFPSPTLFSRQIESQNFPALIIADIQFNLHSQLSLPPPNQLLSFFQLFNGCVKDWASFTKWNPRNGGLEYLEERVGSSTVEAMLSKSAPVFYGDLRSHERVPLPFQSFIGFCKQRVENTDVTVTSDSYRSESNETLLSGDDAQQIYLAQVPIMNAEHGDKIQLETLRDDIQTLFYGHLLQVHSCTQCLYTGRLQITAQLLLENLLICIQGRNFPRSTHRLLFCKQAMHFSFLKAV